MPAGASSLYSTACPLHLSASVHVVAAVLPEPVRSLHTSHAGASTDQRQREPSTTAWQIVFLMIPLLGMAVLRVARLLVARNRAMENLTLPTQAAPRTPLRVNMQVNPLQQVAEEPDVRRVSTFGDTDTHMEVEMERTSSEPVSFAERHEEEDGNRDMDATAA
jgi:hypothetical protein